MKKNQVAAIILAIVLALSITQAAHAADMTLAETNKMSQYSSGGFAVELKGLIYYIQQYCDEPGFYNGKGSIKSMKPDGKDKKVVMTVDTHVMCIQSDGTHLYFMAIKNDWDNEHYNPKNTLYRFKVGDKKPTKLAENVYNYYVDAGNLYYVNNRSHTIKRMDLKTLKSTSLYDVSKQKNPPVLGLIGTMHGGLYFYASSQISGGKYKCTFMKLAFNSQKPIALKTVSDFYSPELNYCAWWTWKFIGYKDSIYAATGGKLYKYSPDFKKVETVSTKANDFFFVNDNLYIGSEEVVDNDPEEYHPYISMWEYTKQKLPDGKASLWRKYDYTGGRGVVDEYMHCPTSAAILIICAEHGGGLTGYYNFETIRKP